MKKKFLAAVISLFLSGAAMAAPGGETDSLARATTIVENVEINVSDIEVLPAADQMEVIPESELAHKMSQAEKAHNAAVNDSWGGAITIIAMCIVISALVILSILFLCFGKVSEYLLTQKKMKSSKHHANIDSASTEVDSGDVIAAIAAALAEHFGEGHDMEETILTIRRMKRAYSPWNSKIYNLRQMPEVGKNAPSRSAF